MMPRKYSINKPMLVAGVGYFALFILFMISKIYIPYAIEEWSEPPIIDLLFFLGTGICISIITFGFTYYSWKLDANEYIEWYKTQQRIGSDWIKIWKNYSESYVLWSTRLISPLFFLIGITLTGIILVAIFSSLFR